jgi:hypothetical protein
LQNETGDYDSFDHNHVAAPFEFGPRDRAPESWGLRSNARPLISYVS